jgi:putative lipoprotein
MKHEIRLAVMMCAIVLSVGCTKKTNVTPAALKTAISGNVMYLERIALPPNAVVQVQLQDVSRADAPAIVLGEQTITASHQVPIPFRIEYDPKQIQENHTYSITARITIESQLRWTNTNAVRVLTQGNPKDNVSVRVSQVGS